MRYIYTLITIGALGLSAFAAYFFFGSPGEDPLVTELTRFEADVGKWRGGAENGSANAQFGLARVLETANPAFRNYAKAAEYYRKAADQGHVEAQHALGLLHVRGLGVSQNYHRASEWFRLAANFGKHAGAEFALGELYFNGRGVPHSYGQAIGWYRKAANKGHPVAQHVLGLMYREGCGVDQDLVEAFKWLSLAIRGRDRVLAHDAKSDPVREREKLLATMNQWQIDQADKLTGAWRPQR